MSEKPPLGPFELVAMGVGGMIGGGIFSVLGLAVGITGRGAPLSFMLGSLIALFAGYSYVRLALTYRDDGASFTYLANAFPRQPSIADISSWTVVVGYVGTLALYAFTFGAYGADLLGEAQNPLIRIALSVSVLVFFAVINLAGAQKTGHTEDLVVYAKILLLAVFAVAGFSTASVDKLTPVFEKGPASIFMAGALVFVAFEGFQLITSAVSETRDPERNIPFGIYASIFITSLIYILLAAVGLGNLDVAALIEAKEYALAAAARPVLGTAGVVLVGVAALLATSSAINATVFGAARMLAVMARQKRVPGLFALLSARRVPGNGVLAITGLALVFTVLGGLEVIAAFSSLTFLLVSLSVSVANYRLAPVTHANRAVILIGCVLMSLTVLLLLAYLWHEARLTLVEIGLIYCAVAATYGLFRRLSQKSGADATQDAAAVGREAMDDALNDMRREASESDGSAEDPKGP